MINNTLPEPYGTLIDRTKQITFRFEGKEYKAFEGDNVASGLFRNGEKILSRSFKYHRPRGIFSMTGQDANTLISLPTEGNVPADRLLVKEGLDAMGQHYYGSLKNDRLSYVNKLSRFLPVGFYYRAFYKYDLWNKYWRKIFRQLTGLGGIDPKNSGPYYDKQYLFYDAVVVGSGPAGLFTALELAKSKLTTLLLEQDSILGGSLNYIGSHQQLAAELIQQIEKSPHITVMTNSVCNAAYSDNWLSIIQANRLYKTRAKQLFLCAGGFEQPVVFHNNDLPGIMLGSAAQRLSKLYGVKPGHNAVVATTNDSGYVVAHDLLQAGVTVKAVIDYRESCGETERVAILRNKGVNIHERSAVCSASAEKNQHLSSIEYVEIEKNVIQAQKTEAIDCDLLCMCGGVMPSYQLACHLGAKLQASEDNTRFEITNVADNCYVIGSANGFSDLSRIESDAQYQVNRALAQIGLQTQSLDKPSRATAPEFVYSIYAHPKGKDFIDFDEDLQVADIVNSVREGYEDIQLVKRFSTLGMGPSQGRFSAYTSSLLIAGHEKLDPNRTINQVGVTTARPPFSPEKIGHMAGRVFLPKRLSSIHYCHVEMGAQPLIASNWIRPAYYGKKQELSASVSRESLNVRNNVGMVDVSTLGGIEIRGPDSAEFMNRMYTWSFVKQPVGKVRYALLTNESGVVIDDGIACRLTDEHYYVTATTGGVDRVYLQFLKWNAQWRLEIDISHVTSAWCGFNIAGPKARKVLETVTSDIDYSKDAFPYLGVRQGTIEDIPVRVLRVGFVGELGYEVHTPQHYGEALWQLVMQAGRQYKIQPFGIETQRLLRLEKGHIIIGQDTDAITYPEEINMTWAVTNSKPFFVGKKSIEIFNKKPVSRRLVGFEVLQTDAPPILESHLCFDENQKLIGRVTSAGQSAILQKSIGMAYVEPKFSKIGTRFQVRCDDNKNAAVKVVEMPFYDPAGERQSR